MDDPKELDKNEPNDLFIQNLIVKKQEIESAIAGMKESRKASDQYRSSDDFFDELDRADNEISTQRYHTLLERKYSELKKIENLIDKVTKDQSFGLCEECGRKIGVGRLSVAPDATRCIRCQREYEKFESRIKDASRINTRTSSQVDWDDEDDDSINLRITTGETAPIPLDDWEEIDFPGDSINNGETPSPANSN